MSVTLESSHDHRPPRQREVIRQSNANCVILTLSLHQAVSKQIETKNIKLYLINLISIGTLEDSGQSWGEGERGQEVSGQK